MVSKAGLPPCLLRCLLHSLPDAGVVWGQLMVITLTVSFPSPVCSDPGHTLSWGALQALSRIALASAGLRALLIPQDRICLPSVVKMGYLAQGFGEALG